MYKASIEITKINKLKVKFNLIIKNDEKMKNIPNTKLLDVFDFNNSRFLKINPKPYITIDISEFADKGDAWNSNMQINFNKLYLFQFIEYLKKLILGFSDTDIFYIKNKRLYLNSSIANKYSFVMRTPNKAIKMSPAVIYDLDNREIEYEGASLMINTPDNFCTLTYTELKYLLYELEKINMTELSMMLINNYLLMLKANTEPKELIIEKKIIENPIEEPATIATDPIPKPNTIPGNI